MPVKFTSTKAPEAADLSPVTTAINDLAGDLGSQLASIQSDLAALKTVNNKIRSDIANLGPFSGGPDFWCRFETRYVWANNPIIKSSKNIKSVIAKRNNNNTVNTDYNNNVITLDKSIAGDIFYFVQFNYWASIPRKGRGYLSRDRSNRWQIEVERFNLQTNGYLTDRAFNIINSSSNPPENYIETLVWGWEV